MNRKEQSQKELDKMKRDIKSLQTEKEDIGNRIQLLICNAAP